MTNIHIDEKTKDFVKRASIRIASATENSSYRLQDEAATMLMVAIEHGYSMAHAAQEEG
jgi:hypothetical protein